MIVVTGGAGFIGSNLINFLGNQSTQEVVSVDWKMMKMLTISKIKN